jgi:radical SAM superfamily enzyme YgiQ (UPF0313 family)
MIPNVNAESFVMPAAIPTPQPGASVAPSARTFFNHVAGEVVGNVVNYSDLNAFSWYYPGNYLTLNQGRKGIIRTFRGCESVKGQIQF